MPKVSELDVYKEVLSGEKRKSIRRSDFLKFTGGKRPLISSHLHANLIASGLIVWAVVAFFLTFKVMKPESYEWVENERRRIEAAKQKIALIKKDQENKALAQ
ncbi:hypothetical protein MACJ_003793 [Theileria orientalis]|uniref:Uncharacterized protein n=1 Tax=Theileria orientalis TaxID=68886 RepID=A0A976SKL1_THEOR|nr:hypothetical protein MACJ_003793 [Theileria orientalis]